MREKIAGWHGGKGELLDDVLGSRESIAGSDQGKSFQAFYGFLLSQARQEELSGLLDRVHQFTEIAEHDPRLRHVRYDWLDAAERTQATVRQLSEQLRRFLDDQVWFENRRVIDILRGIESHALQLRDMRNIPVNTELDAPSPAIRLPLERPLYAPVEKTRIDSEQVRNADEETDPGALFEQVYVDSGTRTTFRGGNWTCGPWLCRELKLAPEALPFAGELIAVRPEEADWEGAAERLLHSFALSVLVPDGHYAVVSDWINGHHLNGRIVYYRVPETARAGRAAPPALGGKTLAVKLELKDTPFAPWLERELASRADVECVETMAEFRRLPRAITKAGQIKGGGGRHEKDDRKRIDDRSTYVLGWSSERKTDALLNRATALAARLTAISAEEDRHKKARDGSIERGQVLAGLDQTRGFAEIDWQSMVNRAEELKSEQRALEHRSVRIGSVRRAHLWRPCFVSPPGTRTHQLLRGRKGNRRPTGRRQSCRSWRRIRLTRRWPGFPLGRKTTRELSADPGVNVGERWLLLDLMRNRPGSVGWRRPRRPRPVRRRDAHACAVYRR